ncbi:MBL fold metallo-hydrolase [Paenisporosarcina cavernae]|uniref:MBL fold metallo-hydrolase n=1 Tax=Paenisporosarcina cavernae TaxID=2320858 RepID=A0A385YRY3_9BACL|nr:MBL fold metallo-hydrolase [Paenisporosarcina cavernae]AYC29509.1 MBL fold metallo-hydrolase [Paenisporosarcina cavernae]
MITRITIPTPFAVGDVHSYLVQGDVLSLIDVGPKTPEALEALNRGFTEANRTFEEVEQIILTHHHPDHAGWLDAFPNARVLGHAYNDAWLRRDDAFFQYHDAFYLDRLKEEGVPAEYYHWVEKMKRPVTLMGNRPLDMELRDMDEVPGHPGWIVMETLGHAQSHLSFWNETTGELIGGDLLLPKISSNPLIEPPTDPSDGRPKSMLQYNESLRKLLEIPVKRVYPGHGDPIDDAHTLIVERLEKQHNRAMQVHDMLAETALSTFEVTQRLFPKVYEKELGLTLSETIGQLDYLLEEGLINETKRDDGVFLYGQV